jgi:hypothetical protein
MRTTGSDGRHEHRPEARFDDGKRQHLPMWEDPSIVGINRREMHVPLKCFESRAQSLLFTVNDTAPTRNVLPLSPALWRFKHTVGVDKAPRVLESVGCDEQTNTGDGDWVDIQVPQSWETAGHGKPIYTNFRSRRVVQQGCWREAVVSEPGWQVPLPSGSAAHPSRAERDGNVSAHVHSARRLAGASHLHPLQWSKRLARHASGSGHHPTCFLHLG